MLGKISLFMKSELRVPGWMVVLGAIIMLAYAVVVTFLLFSLHR